MGVSEFFLLLIFLFLLLESPLKNLGPYDKSSRDILEIRPFSGQNRVNQGGRGGPRLYFLMGILLFMLLGSPRKNLELYDKSFWNIFENRPFSGQNRVNWEGRRGHRNSFFTGILLFLLLRRPCKNSEPQLPSFWNKSKGVREREEEEEKITASTIVTTSAQLRSDQFYIFLLTFEQ